MTYFPKPRIASFTISTVKTGVLLKLARVRRRPPGKEVRERLVGRRRQVSTSAISILVALAAPEALTLQTCSAAQADPLGAVIADKMSRLNWSCPWKKRI